MKFTLSVRSFHVPATPALGLSAKSSFSSDFARHAGYFAREYASCLPLC